MAYNTLEHLEKGIVDFVYSLTAYDYTNLIKSIRKNENKLKIINGFLLKLIDTKPQFCFEIIYDMPEFIIEAEYILNKYYTVETISKETLDKLLNNSQLGLNFLKNNLEQILIKFEKDLTFILKYLFENFNECLNILKKISLHYNLHIRFLFMKYLL